MAKLIEKRQLENLQITNNDIAAAAGIATNKLLDGAAFIRSDGTVPFLANQSLGGFKLVNVGTPTQPTDALRLSELTTLRSEKGQPNGYPSLDGGGKIPASQLPNSVMELQGNWNAATNTPTLIDSIGNPGDVYQVTVAGTQNLGSGNITFSVGDFIIYGSSGAWFLSLNSNAVVSVFGRTGTITALSGDYSSFYPLLNGTGANGTWGISITGNANSATNWGGYPANFATNVTAIDVLAAFDSATSTFRSANKGQVQTYLDINNGATINNNISGTSALAYNSAQWNGYDFDKSNAYGSGFDLIFGRSAGINEARLITQAGMQNYVGTNNGSTLNNNITGSATSVPWTGVTGTPVFALKSYVDSNFTPKDGVGAFGTWAINITGNANNWGQRPADLTSEGTQVAGIVAYDFPTNQYKFFGPGLINSYLGINNGSTLSNSISGNAPKWGGNVYNGTSATDVDYFLSTKDGQGDWRPAPISLTKTKLGIDNGSTLNNNILGRSRVADKVDNGSEQMAFEWLDGGAQPTWVWGSIGADKAKPYNPALFNVNSAVYWGGRSAELNNTSVLLFAPVVIDGSDGKGKLGVVSQFQSWLGLGAFAYRNSINGNEIGTDVASAGADIGVAKVLRWKNYANGHVIFDASNGTSPSGSAVNPNNSANAWDSTYPTLMGWNGASTYGVRVDSARTANGLGTAILDQGNIRDNPGYLWGRRADVDEITLISGLGVRRLAGIPDGGETLPSVLGRGNIGGQGQFLALRASDPANGYLELKNVLNSNGSAFRLVSGVWALSQDGFSIYNNNSGTNFHIAESGNVGIGYASDQGYKFAVNGTSLFSGGMVVNGGTTINAVLSVNSTGAFTGDVTAPSFRASNWFRSTGNTGWYNETYDGGIYMSDETWVRVYNGKGFLVNGSTGIESPKYVSTAEGFKSNTFRGLVGDYELTDSSDKIIWTIGASWNTVESMYGIGYQYTSKYSSGHQIVFRESGVVRASIDATAGNGWFDGKLVAAGVQATNIGVSNNTGGGNGLSLYNGASAGFPSYGISFANTSNFGSHGSVVGDWATYFTMSGAQNRGWIFRHDSGGRIASIDSYGNSVFNGTVSAVGGFFDTSDIRLKTVVDKTFNVENINAIAFKWKSGDKRLHSGYSAQEVQKYMPDAVNVNLDGILSVNYNEVHTAKIARLEQEVEQLKRKLYELGKFSG